MLLVRRFGLLAVIGTLLIIVLPFSEQSLARISGYPTTNPSSWSMVLAAFSARTVQDLKGAVATWMQVQPDASPPGRHIHAMAHDANRGRTVLFGGVDDTQYLDDTWEWDGMRWEEHFPVTSPSARYGHAMAYDNRRGVVVLFGGCDDGGNLNDTWEWDGTNWARRLPLSSPPTRRGHAMAYDRVRNVVVLFGGWGESGGGYLADTWEWDGTNWLQRTPSQTPPKRSGHAMAYDGACHCVLLFGGRDPVPLSDTWQWSGVTWTRRTPSVSPSPRYRHALAYDDSLMRVLLFGGNDGITTLADTWEWDGASWLQSVPKDQPSSRLEHALVYDSGRQCAVLFGGFANGQLDDTWEYGHVQLSVSPPIRTVPPGGSTSFYLSAEGAAWPITLDLPTLPTGISGYFAPSSIITAPADSGLILTASKDLANGIYPSAVTGHTAGVSMTVPITLAVTTPDFALLPSPTARTIYQVDTASYTISLTSSATFTAPVSMVVAELPAGMDFAFWPNPVAPNATSTLELTTSLSLPVGSYDLTMIGSGVIAGPTESVVLTRTASVSLTVLPSAIRPAVSPVSRIVYQGQTARYTISLEGTPGMTLPATLDAGSLPDGASAAFSPSAIRPGESSMLTVATTASTPLGTHEFSITATTASLVGAVEGVLEVKAAVLLPVMMKRWPPVPYQPTLSSISNPDGDGNYVASWVEVPSRLADTYTLEEATDAAFTAGLREACTTVQQSCSVTGRLAGTYYYRVKGCNVWGCGPHSNTESTMVQLPGTPFLNAIDNADGDANYTVSWTLAARATGYILEEDADSSFATPTIVYQGGGLSWVSAGKAPATYYYRVRATGPTGQSSWSNTQSVAVPTPSPVVRVLSSNAFAPWDFSPSDWYIVGEVRNDTSSNVEYVEISGTLRDGSGNVVDSGSSYSMVDILTPGMTSPFLIMFWDAPAWASYDLQVTWDSTSDQPYALEVLNSTSYFDSSDAFHVVGEIRNQYAEQRNWVRAFVTMYDAQGQVIGADYAYTNPDELNPGQAASFDVEVYSWKYKPDRSKLASYGLQVYDDWEWSVARREPF